MAEAAAAGVLPHIFLDYTHRMLYAAVKGASLATMRKRQGQLWAAWTGANFTRAKRLPALEPLLRKLEPRPSVMSTSAIRSAVLNIAKTMGATVRYVKKKGR